MSKRRSFIAAAILAMLPLQAHAFELKFAEDWSWTRDGALYGAAIVSTLADLGTTLDIKNHEDLEEGCPFISGNPSDSEIIKFFAISRGIILGGSLFLNPAGRVMTVGGFTLASVGAYIHNSQMGLSIKLVR